MRIKYEPNYAYGPFFGTLRRLPIIDKKKSQYGFSGIYTYDIHMYSHACKPQAVRELSPVAADTAPLPPSQNVSKTDGTSVLRDKHPNI